MKAGGKLKIILALLIFSVIIIVHELGHFLFAKKNGQKENKCHTIPVRKLDFIKKLTFALSMDKSLHSGKAVFFSNAIFFCKKKRFSVKKKI